MASCTNTNATSQDWTDRVTFWKPDGVREHLATSGHFFVGILEDGLTVLKYPHRNTLESLSCLQGEADRYAHLGSHENLVTYKGFNEQGLLLEYCEGGVL